MLACDFYILAPTAYLSLTPPVSEDLCDKPVGRAYPKQGPERMLDLPFSGERIYNMGRRLLFQRAGIIMKRPGENLTRGGIHHYQRG